MNNKENIYKILNVWLSKLILKILNRSEKNKFRTLEKNVSKMNKISAHLRFNYTCLNSDLFPIYTNKYKPWWIDIFLVLLDSVM